MNKACIICGCAITPTPRGKYCQMHAKEVFRKQVNRRRGGETTNIDVIIAEIKEEEAKMG